MKTGIYIPGLGQSFAHESLVSYATRLKNEMSYRRTGVNYELKTEKIEYSHKKEANVVTIVERTGNREKPLYRIYEFAYGGILTSRFNCYNILIKNVLLLGLVAEKFPGLLFRLIRPKGFNKPFLTFYLFLIFLLIALSVILTVPACVAMITQFVNGKEVSVMLRDHPALLNIFLFFRSIAEWFIPLSVLILLLAPQVKPIVTTLATEFVCAHYYLAFGGQSQEILGSLDLLVEHIAEREKGARIHFHSYSFGSLVALDYLFTFGNRPSENVQQLVEVLITIGTPVEFVKAYYPRFYHNRDKTMESRITWLNVYSMSDALSSNFRYDAKSDKAVHGLDHGKLIPVNLNYEITHIRKFSITNFISLYSIRAHTMYWDPNPEGQSCARLIYDKCLSQGLM